MIDDVAFIRRNRKMSDIIFNTDSETSPSLLRIEEVEDTLDVFRSGILRGDTITAT